MDTPKLTYEIPVWRWEATIQKRLRALVKRANRKGLTEFQFEVAPDRIVKQFTRMVPCTFDDLPMTGEKPEAYDVECLVVTITCPKPSLNGWRFIGRIEHMSDESNGEAINLVYAAPDEEVPAEFHKREQLCEHCSTKRQRRDTFIVAKANEFKQVGSTCLSDFLGIDAASMLAYAEIIESCGACCCDPDDMTEEEWGQMRQSRCYSLTEILSVAAALTIGCGYVSRKKAEEDFGKAATAELIRSYLLSKTAEQRNKICNTELFTDRSKQLATDTMDWLTELAVSDLDDLGDYLRNLAVIVKVGRCPFKAIGILGSACYSLTRQRERDIQNADAQRSTHQGAIKERLTRTVTVVMVRSTDTQFGTTYIHKFTDADGNRYLWFASRDQGWDVGQQLTIIGTVKKHDTDRFEGDCNITIINQVKETK